MYVKIPYCWKSHVPAQVLVLAQTCYFMPVYFRIGDDLMMHLLEKTSIFILLAPTCYLQLTGTVISRGSYMNTPVLS